MQNTLIFIVAYEAEKHIENVLSRIETNFWNRERGNEVLLIDDASKDNTFATARAWAQQHKKPLKLFRIPVNQGYGGNQKLGYAYAIQKGFKAVVLLHGDGQYAPELLAEMVTPILDGNQDLVLGSRMLEPTNALKGGMPIYKWIGNKFLSWLQNKFLRTRLSEFHTGYRAWSVAALSRLPFLHNSPDFDFDTEIIIQSVDSGLRIIEIPIPTHYGNEICRVNGLRYARQVIYATFISRMQNFGIFYSPKFDYSGTSYAPEYSVKKDSSASHAYAVNACLDANHVLDLGCGDGHVAQMLYTQNIRVSGIDLKVSVSQQYLFQRVLEADIETLKAEDIFADTVFDKVLLLDVIEHLSQPEMFLRKLRDRFGLEKTHCIITTPNIAFIIMRMNLLFGQFNYGKRGILDFTHRRLFTFKTLARALRNEGFVIERIEGIPIPFELIIKNKRIAKICVVLNQCLIRISKTLFAYQIGVHARPLPTPLHLLKQQNA